LSELVINNTPNALMGETNSAVNASNAMSYVSPGVDIPKFVSDQIDKFISRAQSVLHLKAEPRGSGNITATEKTQDAKNTEAFIRPISDEVWLLIEYMVECIGRMQYGDAYEDIEPEIVKPTSFDLLDASDYIAALVEAREANLPNVIIESRLRDAVEAINQSQSEQKDTQLLSLMADRLATIAPEQIAVQQARGLLQPWEIVLHQSMNYIIQKLVRDVDGFMDLELQEKIALLQSEARALLPRQEIALPLATQI
jgi:hypothetical protein